jgi:hypothetical protein
LETASAWHSLWQAPSPTIPTCIAGAVAGAPLEVFGYIGQKITLLGLPAKKCFWNLIGAPINFTCCSEESDLSHAVNNMAPLSTRLGAYDRTYRLACIFAVAAVYVAAKSDDDGSKDSEDSGGLKDGVPLWIWNGGWVGICMLSYLCGGNFRFIHSARLQPPSMFGLTTRISIPFQVLLVIAVLEMFYSLAVSSETFGMALQESAHLSIRGLFVLTPALRSF